MPIDRIRRSEIGRDRRRRTAERIIRGMIDVLSRVPFDAIKTDDFVRAAGVSRGSFYNYFKTRDDVAHGIATLLNAIIERRIAQVDDPGASTLDRVGVGIAAYLETATREPNITRVMFNEYLSHYPQYPTFVEGTVDRTDSLIRSGAEQGLFVAPNDRLISHILGGALAFSLVEVVEAPAAQKAEISRQATVHMLLLLGVTRAKAVAAAKRAVDRVALASLDVVDECIDDLVDELIRIEPAVGVTRAAGTGTH